MPEETPTGPPPSVDSVKAAQNVPAAPAPAPEPEPELEEIPEGDQFPREYVEKLRGEAAKFRTRARDIESSFEGYSPQERQRFLDLASQLNTDPEGALVEFESVTANLRKITGKDTPVSEEPTPTEPVVAPVPEPAATAPTTEDIERIVVERLDAERAAQAKTAEVDATLAEAEALGDGEQYKSPAAKAQLFATAQHHQVSLAEAHDLLSGDFQSALDAAVEARLGELSKGRAHPPRLPAGDPNSATDQGPPKTLEEARRRAEARMDAAYGTQ